MRDLKNAGFAERGTEDLQTDREFAVNFAARNGDSGDACKRTCNRVDIREIHLQRISGAFTKLERRDGRGR